MKRSRRFRSTSKLALVSMVERLECENARHSDAAQQRPESDNECVYKDDVRYGVRAGNKCRSQSMPNETFRKRRRPAAEPPGQ